MDDTKSLWPNVSLLVDSIVRDVYFGCRLLWKNVTVTAVAVVSLSLAIGACTSAFALIDALILRPLPVRNPERLINVVYRSPGDANDSPGCGPKWNRSR